MNELDSPKTIDELLEPGMTLMVGTQSVLDSHGEVGISSRPLTVADASGDLVRIIVDSSAEFARQAMRGERAHVTLSDNRKNVWASLDATMAMSTDTDEIDELWSPFASAYFPDGRESQNIAVLHLRVLRGMYWSTPAGRIGSAISLLKAALGKENDSGEHGAVVGQE